MRSQTDQHFSRLRKTVEEHERRIGIPAGHVYDDLVKTRELALAQADAEVKLFFPEKN